MPRRRRRFDQEAFKDMVRHRLAVSDVEEANVFPIFRCVTCDSDGTADDPVPMCPCPIRRRQHVTIAVQVEMRLTVRGVAARVRRQRARP